MSSTMRGGKGTAGLQIRQLPGGNRRSSVVGFPAWAREPSPSAPFGSSVEPAAERSHCGPRSA
jgi:hypothetical protein